MEVSFLREKLIDYINVADEQHLNAIFTLVEDSIPETSNDIYDKEMMGMLYARRENHKNGASKSYSVEESFNLVTKM